MLQEPNIRLDSVREVAKKIVFKNKSSKVSESSVLRLLRCHNILPWISMGEIFLKRTFLSITGVTWCHVFVKNFDESSTTRNSTRWAPEPIVINGGTGRGPYKWHYKWVSLGLFHPYEWSYTITYNWFRGPTL